MKSVRNKVEKLSSKADLPNLDSDWRRRMHGALDSVRSVVTLRRHVKEQALEQSHGTDGEKE